MAALSDKAVRYPSFFFYLAIIFAFGVVIFNGVMVFEIISLRMRLAKQEVHLNVALQQIAAPLDTRKVGDFKDKDFEHLEENDRNERQNDQKSDNKEGRERRQNGYPFIQPVYQGPPGPMGPKGEKGDRGDMGYRGKAGPKGGPGRTGPEGPKGDSGRPGQQGLPGNTGQPGHPGYPGLPGRKGEQGETGQTGATGPKGETGHMANITVFSEYAHIQGNGKVKKLSPGRRVTEWIASSQTEKTKYNSEGGFIQIQIRGMYYVYAQMYYFDNTSPPFMGHTTHKNNKPILKSSSCLYQNRRYYTNYHGGVFLLKKGDIIYVTVPLYKEYNMDNKMSYFGVFLLNALH